MSKPTPQKAGTGGNGITVSGDGAVRFVSPADAYTVLSGEHAGLVIRSTGDLGSLPGSVTVTTSGYFVGRYGIDAVNYGSGATTFRFDGTAIGQSVGISARNANIGNGGLFITAGADSWISGDTAGLWAFNGGSGPTDIRVDGYALRSGHRRRRHRRQHTSRW